MIVVLENACLVRHIRLTVLPRVSGPFDWRCLEIACEDGVDDSRRLGGVVPGPSDAEEALVTGQALEQA
jgi:hypothetical protein